MHDLKRYWIIFEENENLSSFLLQRCYGVTAFDYSDAINILNDIVFKQTETPVVENYTENIDIRNLDQGHVILNMAPPNYRGIWFPLGYQNQ